MIHKTLERLKRPCHFYVVNQLWYENIRYIVEFFVNLWLYFIILKTKPGLSLDEAR